MQRSGDVSIYVWNQSLLTISLPFFFLIAETGEISFEEKRSPIKQANSFSKGYMYTTHIIFLSAVIPTSSTRQDIILDDLLASGYFLSFACTISSTLLIVYRIYNSLSGQDNHSKKRFVHIVDALVQSATAYSLALMVAAIANVVLVTSRNIVSVPLYVVLSYEGASILFFVSVHTFGVQILGKV